MVAPAGREPRGTVVNGPPEPELPPRDRYGHLVEMPARRWPRTPTAKFSREQRSELQDPASHRLVGDIQPTLRERTFDVAIAEREAHIEPNGVPDDHRRELMARERNRHAQSYLVRRTRDLQPEIWTVQNGNFLVISPGWETRE